MCLHITTFRVGVMSANVSFLVDRLIMRKTIKYINKSDNSPRCVFNLITSRIGRLIAD